MTISAEIALDALRIWVKGRVLHYLTCNPEHKVADEGKVDRQGRKLKRLKLLIRSLCTMSEFITDAEV